MKEESKKKKILKVSGLIGLFLLVFGLSYALFTVTLNGTKKVKIKTGKLELQLLDSNNNPIYITDQNNTTSYEINLDNQVPVSDEVGLDTKAFEFKLKNTGNIKASYTIYLDDVALESGETRIDDQYIRYSLTKNGSEENPQALSSRKLDEGTIDTDNATNTYTLKMWIAEDATNEAMDKVFNATLRVEGTQYVAPPASEYGVKIASTQLSETITATYYQPEDTGYNSTSKIKRMSNVERLDNEETYEGGTLVISGEGEMPDYEYDEGNPPLIVMFMAGVSTYDEFVALYDLPTGKYFPFKYNPINIVVEEGITKIGDCAFPELYYVDNVKLPNTLRSIGYNAFAYAPIVSINFPEELEFIGEDAFYGNNLSEIKIPRSLKQIEGEGQFDDSQSLETIYFHKDFKIVNGYNNIQTHKPLIIYCETQEVANQTSGYIGPYIHSYSLDDNQNPRVTIVVDPTKFE